MNSAQHIASCLLDGEESAKDFIHRYRTTPYTGYHPINKITNTMLRSALRKLGFKAYSIRRSKQRNSKNDGEIQINAAPAGGFPLDGTARQLMWTNIGHRLQAELGELGHAVEPENFFSRGFVKIYLQPADLDAANMRNAYSGNDFRWPENLLKFQQRQKKINADYLRKRGHTCDEYGNALYDKYGNAL